MNFKSQLFVFVLIIFLLCCKNKPEISQYQFKTFCNPINLNYRFCPDRPSRREAADPTVILFKDKYLLFASKSGGYWCSDDLIDWKFIETNDIPIEDYAPTAIVLEDTLYFMASSHEKNAIYKSADPLSGKWQIALGSLEIPVWDPAFFLDDDNRLYLYWGCSDVNPLYGVEVNYKNNFKFVDEPKELKHANPSEFGWEVPGDYNNKTERKPWIEGAWLNKYKGKYYLQYSGPGTEFKSYSDGVYIADNPLGPYSVATHNPFAYKPEGFASGAGHGSTFKDKFGNYWHIGTTTISVKHMFERRLVLYPAFFDKDGILYSNTRFGDYPLFVPDKKIENDHDLFTGWMLLSYNKKVEVSSSIDSLPSTNMIDEDIRSFWSARSGDYNEYATIDLGNKYDIYAVQINFAEHNTEIYGRQEGLYHRYIIEYSNDNSKWKLLVDESQNQSDNTHAYMQLDEKVNCRYLRVRNIEVPGGNFALSGFRVFGLGDGHIPNVPKIIEIARNEKDKRKVKLSWQKVANATGYNICFGSAKDKLYHNYIVYQDTLLEINSLNGNQKYYFAIESFNENGVSLKSKQFSIK